MRVMFYQAAQMDVYQAGMLGYQNEIKSAVSMCFEFGDVVGHFRAAGSRSEYALTFVNDDNRARRRPLRPCLNAFPFGNIEVIYFVVV